MPHPPFLKVRHPNLLCSQLMTGDYKAGFGGF
jgi:hypothetical protein